MKTCGRCGNRLSPNEFCPHCGEAMNPPDPATMTPEARAAGMETLGGGDRVPFDVMRCRLEALLGRPVLTHEMMSNWDRLVEQARRRESFDG